MTIEQQRVEVAKAYDNPLWKQRVSKMSDNQIVAIYLRLKQQNKL